MLETLSYAPVLKGFIILILTGFAFPITGVYLLRMNLLPLRFMLMHGAILGGALSLALEVNPFAGTLVINLLLVLLMTRMSRSLQTDPGQLSAFFMVVSISIIVLFDAPSSWPIAHGHALKISPDMRGDLVHYRLFSPAPIGT